MAKEKTITQKGPEPEVAAMAVVRAKGGLWVSRTYLIQGDRILAYTDSEPDAKPAAVGRCMAMLRRVE